jgi:flagellar hook-associated protein 3 FlgL
MNRVTSVATVRRSLADLMAANSSLVDAQARASSQKQLQRASDGPAQALAALEHRGVLRRSAQQQRNASDARSWLSSADTALASSVDELTRVRTLVSGARSGASDPNARKAVADEIRTIRTAMLSLANTEHLGRPIFAGTAATDVAFAPDGTYQGDTGAVRRPIAPAVDVQVNRSGSSVFGTQAAVPMDGNVFQVLDALAAAVEAGDDSAMATGIVRVDTSIDRVESAQVELGARARQVDDVVARSETADLDRRQALSELEDVDIAEAILDLKAREVGYQVALSATAQVSKLSLLDFLR